MLKKEGNQAIGKSCGGLTTKIHTVVNAIGNPTSFALTEGNRHGLDGTSILTEGLKAKKLLADKAYDCSDFINALDLEGITAVIPSRSNRKKVREIDIQLFKAKHLIENFFAKLKHQRCIATRSYQLARNFPNGIYLVARALWHN